MAISLLLEKRNRSFRRAAALPNAKSPCAGKQTSDDTASQLQTVSCRWPVDTYIQTERQLKYDGSQLQLSQPTKIVAAT